MLRSCSDPPTSIADSLSTTINSELSREQALDASKEPATAKFSRDATTSRLECGPEENYGAFDTVMEKRNRSPFQVTARQICVRRGLLKMNVEVDMITMID